LRNNLQRGLHPPYLASNVWDFAKGRFVGIGQGAWGAANSLVEFGADLMSPSDPASLMRNIQRTEQFSSAYYTVGPALQDMARSYFTAARSGNWYRAGQIQGQQEGPAVLGFAASGVAGKILSAEGIGKLTAADFPKIGTKVKNSQLRHIKDSIEYRGGGVMNSMGDAQKVLDAYHAGRANILGKNVHGFPVVQVEGVIGTNINLPHYPSQQTSVFVIKGTTKVSIVPINPTWRP
jgi:hypothetical protein